jgi:hypothetical protein
MELFTAAPLVLGLGMGAFQGRDAGSSRNLVVGDRSSENGNAPSKDLDGQQYVDQAIEAVGWRYACATRIRKT